MILLNDEQADKCCDQYLLGEIENKIKHQGRYKIISSYRFYNTGNADRYLFTVLNTETKQLSTLPVL